MAKLERQIQAEIVKDLKAAGYLVSTHPAPIGWPDIRAFRIAKVVLIEALYNRHRSIPLHVSRYRS